MGRGGGSEEGEGREGRGGHSMGGVRARGREGSKGRSFHKGGWVRGWGRSFHKGGGQGMGQVIPGGRGGSERKGKVIPFHVEIFSDRTGKVIPYRGSSNSLEECLGQSVVHKEVVDVCHQQTPIPVVSDVTTIVDASDKVLESIPRSFIIAIKVQTQQIL